MAIRKTESWGWLTSGNEATAIPKRWSTYAFTNTLGSPGRRASTNYVTMANNADCIGHTFDNQQTWILHCAVRFRNSDHRSIQYNDSGTPQMMIGYLGSSTSLTVQRGAGGTVIGSSSSGIASGTWYHMAVRVLIHASAGEVQIQLDGVNVVNVTSVATQNSSNAWANQIILGSEDFHDIVICDGTGAAPYNGIIGNMAVDCAIPDGAGAISEWTPSTGSNYQNIDDTTPDSDTTYNETNTASEIDRYAVSPATPTGLCRGVTVSALIRKDDIGLRTARVKLYDGTALQSGTTTDLSTSYAFIEHTWPVNPTTGANWTAGEIAVLEPGIELVS